MKKIYSLVFMLVLSMVLLGCSNNSSGGNESYSVVLRGNGGTPISNTISVRYGSSMPAASKPSRSGYTFLGYYDSMYQVSGTKYYNANMTSARNWDKQSGGTLYAVWKYNG